MADPVTRLNQALEGRAGGPNLTAGELQATLATELSGAASVLDPRSLV